MILKGPFQLEMFSNSIKNHSWLQNSAGQTENGSSSDKWNRLEKRSLGGTFEVAGRWALRHCNMECLTQAKRRLEGVG